MWEGIAGKHPGRFMARSPCYENRHATPFTPSNSYIFGDRIGMWRGVRGGQCGEEVPTSIQYCNSVRTPWIIDRYVDEKPVTPLESVLFDPLLLG